MEEQIIKNLRDFRLQFEAANWEAPTIISFFEIHEFLLTMIDVHENYNTIEAIRAALIAFEKDPVWIAWQKKKCEEK